MNKNKKILCLVILFAIAFSGLVVTPFITHREVATVPTGPFNSYLVAAAATSDAIATGANNITNTRGAAGSNYVFAGAYESYTLVVNASDADGYADIMNITVEFAKGAVSYGGFIYNSSGGTVNTTVELVAGAANVRLGAWSNISAVNDIDLTIAFHFEWAIGSVTDMDINVTVMEAAASTELAKNANIDIVGTLTLSDALLFSFNEYLNEEAFGTMALTYHYTGYTTIYPIATETDFYVSMAAVPGESIGARAWESSAYSQTTGIANFNNIVAPDTNSIITLTFTEYAVTQSGGSSGTTLMATTNTDTVIINPDANTVDRTTRENIVGSSIFETPEGVMLIGGVAAVILIGGYIAYERGSVTTSRRRHSTKRKSKRRKSSRRR